MSSRAFQPAPHVSARQPKKSAESDGIAYPQLVLRVGFAGTQTLPAEPSEVSTRLESVLEAIAQRLVEIAPGTPIEGSNPAARVAKFYSREIPLLRLITGLCEGADSLAAHALGSLSAHKVLGPYVATELAAVIPFDVESYRRSRPSTFRSEFDRQAAACSYIIELDARHEKPDPDTSIAKSRRGRAYRAQATLLLRQSDLIVAVADPNGSKGAGGTMDTVRAALAFNLPVVFIHTEAGQVTVIEPGDDPAEVIAGLSVDQHNWREKLEIWVCRLTADPDIDLDQPGVEPEYSMKFLNEYFDHAESASPSLTSERLMRRIRGVGEWSWGAFIKSCQPEGARPKSDEPLYPYAAWRSRSTSLNYYYSGNYRGAFFLNYILAAAAVGFASLSLVLITKGIAGVVLLFLAFIKLGIVTWISVNTFRANRGNWNDRAVDYRYLAERLRAMFYLPRIGSFQPPAATPLGHATRAVRQSAVDWLLNAIVRSISPACIEFVKVESFDFEGNIIKLRLLRPAPVTLLNSVRDRWVWPQAVYHDGTARSMEAVYLFVESWGRTLSLAVIGFVAADVLVTTSFFGWLPERSSGVESATPWLIFLAALLPAIVASLNGIRFQSECRRLAERSAIMRTLLCGRDSAAARKIGFLRSLLPMWPRRSCDSPPPPPKKGRWAAANLLIARIEEASRNPETDPASWTPEVLRLTEAVAEVFVQEVAEWSVLYAKELPEP